MQTLYLYGIALRMDLEKCFLESSNVGKIWISVFLLLALINMAKISNNLFLTIVFRAKWFAFEGVDILKQSFYFEISSSLNRLFFLIASWTFLLELIWENWGKIK